MPLHTIGRPELLRLANERLDLSNQTEVVAFSQPAYSSLCTAVYGSLFPRRPVHHDVDGDRKMGAYAHFLAFPFHATHVSTRMYKVMRALMLHRRAVVHHVYCVEASRRHVI